MAKESAKGGSQGSTGHRAQQEQQRGQLGDTNYKAMPSENYF